jgi:hypothetical protein
VVREIEAKKVGGKKYMRGSGNIGTMNISEGSNFECRYLETDM